MTGDNQANSPGNESQRRPQTLSAVALGFSVASLLLATPTVYQGMTLLREVKPLTHTTLMFRGTAIPCLVCALIGLFLGRRAWGTRFGKAAVLVASITIVAILLIALPQ